jgi:hypothetical protein
VLLLGLIALLVFLSVCARLGERVRPDAEPDLPDPAPVVRAWRALRGLGLAGRGGAVPAGLPPGHRPPAGLGPLSPSERFLRTESARGITALQLWLLDQAV